MSLRKGRDPHSEESLQDVLQEAAYNLVRLYEQNPNHPVFAALRGETTRPGEKRDMTVLNALKTKDTGELMVYLQQCNRIDSIFHALGISSAAMLNHFLTIPLDGNPYTPLAEPLHPYVFSDWLKEGRISWKVTSGRNNSCLVHSVALVVGIWLGRGVKLPTALHRVVQQAEVNAAPGKRIEYVGQVFRKMISSFVQNYPDHPKVRALSSEQRDAIDGTDYLEIAHLHILVEIIGIPVLICPQRCPNRTPHENALASPETCTPSCMSDRQFVVATGEENLHSRLCVLQQVKLSNGAYHFEAGELCATDERDLQCLAVAVRQIHISCKELYACPCDLPKEEKAYFEVATGTAKIAVNGSCMGVPFGEMQFVRYFDPLSWELIWELARLLKKACNKRQAAVDRDHPYRRNEVAASAGTSSKAQNPQSSFEFGSHKSAPSSSSRSFTSGCSSKAARLADAFKRELLPGQWECSLCETTNEKTATQCTWCDAPKPKDAKKTEPAMSLSSSLLSGMSDAFQSFRTYVAPSQSNKPSEDVAQAAVEEHGRRAAKLMRQIAKPNAVKSDDRKLLAEAAIECACMMYAGREESDIVRHIQNDSRFRAIMK